MPGGVVAVEGFIKWLANTVRACSERPVDRLHGGRGDVADGIYSYPLPAGTYTMAANGDVSRVGAAGGTVAVPVIGKVTGVTVSARQIVTADITATERPDLIDKTADLAELPEIRAYGSTS